VISSKNSKKN